MQHHRADRRDASIRCLVSGLRDVIVDRQSLLLDAAVQAGIKQFISLTFFSGQFKSSPGHNRNFDQRREFAGRADRASISVTSPLQRCVHGHAGCGDADHPALHPLGSTGDPVTSPWISRPPDDTTVYTAADIAAAMTRVPADLPTG